MGRIRNETLRALRKQRGWTQTEFAERIAAELDLMGVNAAPVERLVSKWESGEIQWPHRHYREALRRIFGVADDAALGFVSPRDRNTGRSPRVLVHVLDCDGEGAVQRAAFLRGVAAVAFATTVGEPLQTWLGTERSRSARTARVGASEVEAIERTTSTFATWDNTRGGALSVDAIMAQLNWAATMLDDGRFSSDAVRQRMSSAVANLAGVAGWAAYDAGLHPEARRALVLGVHAAAEGDDWPLRASLLSDLARQAITLDSPNDALDLLRLAHYGAQDTATATTRAMLHVVTARAHGAAGNTQACLRSVDTAEDLYANRNPDDDPVWIQYYSSAQLAGDSGHALYDASLHTPKLRERTAERLLRAVATYGPEYPRSAAFCAVRAAAIRFDEGEPEEGIACSRQLLQLASGIGSARLAADYTMLREHARPYRHIDDVSELEAALTSPSEHA